MPGQNGMPGGQGGQGDSNFNDEYSRGFEDGYNHGYYKGAKDYNDGKNFGDNKGNDPYGGNRKGPGGDGPGGPGGDGPGGPGGDGPEGPGGDGPEGPGGNGPGGPGGDGPEGPGGEPWGSKRGETAEEVLGNLERKQNVGGNAREYNLTVKEITSKMRDEEGNAVANDLSDEDKQKLADNDYMMINGDEAGIKIDKSSFDHLTRDDVIMDPTQGMEIAKRAGYDFSSEDLEQVKKMQEEGELSNMERIQKVKDMIQDEVDRKHGWSRGQSLYNSISKIESDLFPSVINWRD